MYMCVHIYMHTCPSHVARRQLSFLLEHCVIHLCKSVSLAGHFPSLGIGPDIRIGTEAIHAAWTQLQSPC